MGNLLARYFDRLYTNVPEDSFHRITSAHPQKPESEDATKLSPTQRLLWSLELLTVTRGIGWNWRVSSFPKPLPATSRSRFVTTQLLKFVAMYAALHVIEVTCRMILLSSSSPSPGPSPPSAPSSLPIPYNLHLYIVIVFGCATKIYSHFAILILPLSALCVGLQVGPTSWRSPTAWPSNFGRLRDAYSIRRFWGITWHQQLRRLLGAPGAYLLGVLPGWTHLRASRGRWARLFRRYTLLLMSFFISGLVHAAGSWQVTRALGRPLSDGGEIRYFVLQGVAIVGEDLVGGEVAQVVGVSGPWTRVHWKVVPVALAAGIRDERGDLFAAVEFIRLSAKAVPGNVVTMAWDMLL
ncbi:wax synthase family protein [Aspergillus stella-maris]|uniref:wax synthase family protein n=1 Tax=Aspergillus stella-maris TaxID=1810926 RepID=UPI003CCCBB7D